jgi:Protein of unknown function (DUF3126)
VQQDRCFACGEFLRMPEAAHIDWIRRTALKPDELRKLDAYFKRVFMNQALQVKARPRKDDSAELFLGEEFLGIVYRDDEDGDLSYNFSMAILEVDL